MRQSVSISRDHGDRLRLQHHQRAIQRVARLFARYGKPRLRNHRPQHGRRNLDRSRGRKHRKAREIRLRHPHHLRVGAAAANADPMIVQQPDGDVGVRQQPYVVIKFARRNRARAFFFNFRIARRAQAQIEVGRRQRQLVPGGLEKIVGENRNRGLALHHALSGCQFAKEFEFADRNFHGHCGNGRSDFHRHIGSPDSRTGFTIRLASARLWVGYASTHTQLQIGLGRARL